MLHLDMEAKVCPLWQDRMQRCEEEGWQGKLPGDTIRSLLTRSLVYFNTIVGLFGH